jgi:hypothetical protein
MVSLTLSKWVPFKVMGHTMVSPNKRMSLEGNVEKSMSLTFLYVTTSHSRRIISIPFQRSYLNAAIHCSIKMFSFSMVRANGKLYICLKKPKVYPYHPLNCDLVLNYILPLNCDKV